LLPGINKVDDNRWEALAAQRKWARAVSGLKKDKILIVTDHRAKLTVELVKKTLDLDLLKSWEEDPKYKGPLKSAIRKQLKLMESTPDDTGDLL
jgi:hypothetical protein